MRKTMLKFVAIALSMVLVAACSKNDPVAPTQEPEQGKMMFAMSAADNVVSGTVSITKGALTQTLPITIANYTGTVQFPNLQVGHWHIQVRLFDAEGIEIYSGEGDANVSKNQTTSLSIQVQKNKGTLEITVVMPDDAVCQIMYTNNMQIFKCLTDGTGIEQMTFAGENLYANNYRNGTRLVYTSGGCLYLMDLDGNNKQAITGYGYFRPRWSWDGSRIVANTTAGGSNSIVVMDPNGQNITVVANNDDDNPCWTPDNRIVYSRFLSGQGRAIMVMNADGSNKQAITDYTTDKNVTDCSVDNKVLFYENGKIFSINIDGSGLTQLANGYTPAFSADGKKIVYSDGTYLHIMDADGNNQKQIGDTPVAGVWSYFVY